MKQNNVLIPTDLRNPDIDSENVVKTGFYCKSSVTWADWQLFLYNFIKERSNNE